MMRGGTVSLVGAGPGDPELLTVKAARRLEAADLLLYDGLVQPELIALAPRAQRFRVSKRHGRRDIEQATIERLMIREARRGKRVVRLKCGDPFVLGRGGEEALALAAAGVPCEIIPGVTAAVSAPALAGIPVTHRGLASGFTVVSGHAPEAYEPLLSAVAPGSMTIVVLMGLRRRAAIARTLLQRGWRPGTPAAIVVSASNPDMQVWTGSLGGLAAVRDESAAWMDAGAPGTIVVGAVAGLGAQATRLHGALAEARA